MKEKLEEIILSNSLKKTGIDFLTNVAIDFAQLPGLSAIYESYNSITDRIFLTKAFRVINELADVNWKERARFINEMDDAESSGTEKLILALDSIQTTEKCVYFGRLCKMRALEKITLTDFFRIYKLIQDAYIPDLDSLKECSKFIDGSQTGKLKGRRQDQIDSKKYSALEALGLLYRFDKETEQRMNTRFAMATGPAIKTNSTHYDLTDIGRVVFDQFEELFG